VFAQLAEELLSDLIGLLGVGLGDILLVFVRSAL
jgi:hypothetical protein